MPCYSFEGIVPVVDPTTYLHPTAVLIGDVTVGPRCYIGPHASLRGDFGRITVEGNTSIQDSCTLHTGAGSDCIVERYATVGHGSILHGCTVRKYALIGMHSVVLDGAEIGEESLVAALSLVKNDAVMPARHLIAGNPARAVKEFAPEAIVWKNDAYQRLADRSLAALIQCEPLRAPEPDRRRHSGPERAVRLTRAK